MPATDLSPDTLIEIPPTPEERTRALAGILAAGLLRLRTRAGLAPAADACDAHAAEDKSAPLRNAALASAHSGSIMMETVSWRESGKEPQP
jgi:hypothetical protein